MKRRFEFVSLAEAQRRLRSGSNFEPTVSITFDDGYSDNCDHALPLLIRERIPCTYFVALEYIETGKSFPHDDAGVPLTPNSLDQLQFLADNGIEIGVHTRTHPDIGQVANRHTLLDEIVTVKTDLERQLGREIHYFAYPYGLPHNMTGESLEVAREAGYWGVCSAYGGYNLPGEESFHLLRFHGDPEMVRLKNWLSFDRRKLVPRNTPPSPRRELMSSVCDAR
jgi:peptidoglycan/xylan/chitin deacetylase (PgdA/CDA1 family)